MVGDRGIKLSAGQRQRMDRILVFSHGQVVESGSHHELLERGKVYRQLWERQVGSSSLFSGVGSCR